MSDDIKFLVTYSSFYKNLCLKINLTKNQAFLNNRPISVDVEEICQELSAIVRLWDHKMFDTSILDGVKYSVAIQRDNKIEKYEGANVFPDNFEYFMKLIERIEAYGKKV